MSEKYQLPNLSKSRTVVNSATRSIVRVGGIAVIGAIVLIMAYLFWVVIPMLLPASVSLDHQFDLSTEGVLHVSSDDSFEVISLINADGSVVCHDAEDMSILDEIEVSTSHFKTVKPLYPLANTFVALTELDTLVFFQIVHRVRFLNEIRTIENQVDVLFDDSFIDVGSINDFDAFRSDEKLRVVLLNIDGSIDLHEYLNVDDAYELEEPKSTTIDAWSPSPRNVEIMIGPLGRWLFEIDVTNGDYRLINVASTRRTSVEQVGSFRLENSSFQFAEPVLGRYSFLVADDQGRVDHWILGPIGANQGLRMVRTFDYPKPIKKIILEHRRKGFLAVDHSGRGFIGHTTSAAKKRTVVSLEKVPRLIAFSPRADRLIAIHDDSIDIFRVNNKHPETSWTTLWGKVDYEGYKESAFTWQSSSADVEFEPKFSLMPLLFGSIKAAFYAMLVATPIAILGAIYTAMFMSPQMRKLIKPGIEIMAALPTVILGFIAGLWLAPLIEKHLTAIMLLLLIPPLGVLLFAYLTTLLPSRIRASLDGWFGALTVPLLVLLGWLTLANNEWFASLIFQGHGDAKTWLYEVLGVDYDQRNALIIGIAMGLAVIPIIFSIAEDAIYGVPQHLVHGSLALGATRWQTLVRVVLLTASPGIFSAIMIGMGRAVGETMIVLMATGNTPIMDFNLFQGMRTFAANIAVEMPESEVGSTHFRILFLTAFVLFLITFLLNTVAEVVRQRLRARYGNL
ncbi:MAG: ABC transporter permease subunit [Gammaproteobacteria bacterium]|nr:ABC transporter permease subunit [Gammaproteobacteria bacterium]